MFNLSTEFLGFFLFLLMFFKKFGGGGLAEASLEFLVGSHKDVGGGHFVRGL
jgi:hypothetical protein